MGEKREAAVIGAGIVGICVAAYLAEAGLEVTVYDRTGICEETSSGNQAALAFSDIMPLATKGMLAAAPRWLADPEGPLRLPVGYAPKMLPWLIRFALEGRPARRERSIKAQTAMMALAETEMMALLRRAGAFDLVRHDGSLELYESEAEVEAALPQWKYREAAGIAFEHLRGAQLADYQPGLSPRFVAGTFVPGWKTVSDPRETGLAIWAHAEMLGARFVKGRVNSIAEEGGRVVVRLDDMPERRADLVIVAAGAWSHLLARMAGDRIPLETERGYNTTFPRGSFDLRRQLVFVRHGFVATPISSGIRIGGAVEFGGLDRPPDYARARMMVEKAKRFLLGLKTEGGREWMGYRPSLPDSLPVIGRSRASPQVLYAFGHGHLGLTQSAATGRLVRDLVAGEKPAIDLAPFAPQRFQSGFGFG